jgi:Icc-related predicted phosphoesterase
MKILTLSDMVLDTIYSPNVSQRYEDVDLIIGCGDMPYYYLEYVLTALNRPAYFVRGNHARVVEYSEAGDRTGPHGATDLHLQVVNHKGLLLAGIEGSIRYRPAPFMYTQGEYWEFVLGMVPKLLLNNWRYGRYLDILVTHAPSWGIQDRDDLPHQGIKAFRWLVQVFKPTLHVHGHIHIYRQDESNRTVFGKTHVINTYGVQKIEMLEPANRRQPWILTT